MVLGSRFSNCDTLIESRSLSRGLSGEILLSKGMDRMERCTCYTDDWQRTNPDYVVHLPSTPRGPDGYADHVLVEHTPGGDLLAMWTGSSAEGGRESHVVFTRSEDKGKTWTDPRLLVGSTRDGGGNSAMFAFPIVNKHGRIYCFYNKDKHLVDLAFRVTAVLGCSYSDDDGKSWTHSDLDIPYGRTKYDHPDPKVPCNCIVWQKPVRDSKDRPIATFTRVASVEKYPASAPNSHGLRYNDHQGGLVRFENIDDNPSPEDIELTWLPTKEGSLRFPVPIEPERSRGYSCFHEPSVVMLPDKRLFVAASTVSGHLAYSVSSDADCTDWRQPEPLLSHDTGRPLEHPISPAPLYGLSNGKYLLFFHNHDGTRYGGLSPRDMTGRRPTFVVGGEFRPEATQPIWFGEPKLLSDTNGVGIGPESLVWLANYGSLTEGGDKRIYWYADRKHFVLGKDISDQLVDELASTIH